MDPHGHCNSIPQTGAGSPKSESSAAGIALFSSANWQQQWFVIKRWVVTDVWALMMNTRVWKNSRTHNSSYILNLLQGIHSSIHTCISSTTAQRRTVLRVLQLKHGPGGMGEQRKREQNDSYHFDPKQSVPLCASRRGCSRAGKCTGKRENNRRITEE